MFEQLIQGPTGESVTVLEQATFSRFDPPDEVIGSPAEDNPQYALVQAAITTAREKIEEMTRYCFSTQQWKQFQPAFSSCSRFNTNPVYWPFIPQIPDRIELLRRPVQSIDAVTYLDSDGVQQDFDSSNWDLANDALVLKVNKSWPGVAVNREDAVRILFTAGYDDAGSPPNPLPKRLKTAAEFLGGWYYENRIPVSTEPTQDVMFTLNSLLKGFRIGYLPK